MLNISRPKDQRGDLSRDSAFQTSMSPTSIGRQVEMVRETHQQARWITSPMKHGDSQMSIGSETELY